MIKSNNIMVRVGGGFATIEDHIKQAGPFECIKIYKIMKGTPQTEPMHFKDAVVYYLKKNKASDKIIKGWVATEDGEHADLFEAAIIEMKAK